MIRIELEEGGCTVTGPCGIYQILNVARSPAYLLREAVSGYRSLIHGARLKGAR